MDSVAMTVVLTALVVLPLLMLAVWWRWWYDEEERYYERCVVHRDAESAPRGARLHDDQNFGMRRGK